MGNFEYVIKVLSDNVGKPTRMLGFTNLDKASDDEVTTLTSRNYTLYQVGEIDKSKKVFYHIDDVRFINPTQKIFLGSEDSVSNWVESEWKEPVDKED